MEQRERSDAIDVVVAVENDPFPLRDRAQDAIDRRAHLREQKRIAQPLQARAQKFSRLLRQSLGLCVAGGGLMQGEPQSWSET